MKHRHATAIVKLSIFFIIFTCVHIFTVYAESLGMLSSISTPLLLVAVGTLVRLLTWTVPVFLLLSKPLDYLKLQNNIWRGISVGIAIGVLFSLIRIAGIYAFKGSIGIDLNLGSRTWWEEILMVGFSEEVVFRGFILQKIEEISSFWTANIISTILFIFNHFSNWILIEQYSPIDILQHSLSILWISIFLGFLLKKTKSLWSCIVFHSFNNFMSNAIR